MKKISLIGSTGSIGRQVIDVVRRNPDKFQLVALVAGSDEKTLELQKNEFKPKFAALASECNFEQAISDADIVFNAAGGFAGLEYTFKALEAGKTLALANKESLVCGGELVMPLAKNKGVEILPVDSEHSAIWQCINAKSCSQINRLIITASGGAFRDLPKSKLKYVTPEQALNHPTWKMGKKITVDSATLMNKGYEVIEARMLYGVGYDRIETVIQPQSIVHSLVEFSDGAILAQMSYPTMELPITLALTYPERIATSLKFMDFKVGFDLQFKPMLRKDFPCFDLALCCGESGGIMPLILNAADEVAVRSFLYGKIPFTGIYEVVDRCVQAFSNERQESLEQLKELNARAARYAENIITKLQ